jgi:hypothetical protein
LAANAGRIVVFHAQTIHIEVGQIGRGQTPSVRLPSAFRIQKA